jgi:hypothetical protein
MTRTSLAFRLTAILLSLTLSGCIFFESRQERAMRNDPNFKAGYSDGCASANAQGTDLRRGDLVRDETAYAMSKPYRSGWAAGHAACNNTYSGSTDPNVGGMPRRPPGQL